MDSTKNTSVPVCVLLPLCKELKRDVFLHILKSAVWRTKLNGDYVDMLKVGMNGEVFYVKQNDLVANWLELDSKSKRNRQFRLLGFWIARNFPSLAKKFLGDEWEAPQGKTVEVLGNSMISADEIDALIFRKMHLRIMELNVCPSTLEKIKHFVKTPIGIGKLYSRNKSPKMNLFEIKIDYIDRCWKALKFGKFSMKEQTICLSTQEYSRTTIRSEEQGISRKGSQLVPLVKRARLETTISEENRETSSANRSQLVPVVKRLRLETATVAKEKEPEINIANGSQLMNEVELSDANTTEVSTIESFRMDLCEIRKEIGDIAKWINPAGHHVEGPLILKEKDEEIAKMKESIEKLMKQNDILKADNIKKTSLTNSLTKCLDSSSQLYGMLESSSQEQIKDFTEKLAEAEKVKVDLSEKNSKLQQELDNAKIYAASNQSLLENQIQDLTINLSSLEKINVQTSEKNEKLLKQLDDAKNDAASLQNRNQELTQYLSKAEEVQFEMSEQIRKLNEEANNSKNYAEIKEKELTEAKKDLSKAKEAQLEMSENIRKLGEEANNSKNYAEIKEKELTAAMKVNEELNALTFHANSLVTELHLQIQNYEKDQSKSDGDDENEDGHNENEDGHNENEDGHNENEYGDDMNSESGVVVFEKNMVVKLQEDVLDEHGPDLKSKTEVETFETDDPIVKACRDKLLKLSFGWIKFYSKKTVRSPGFKYPPDPDGYTRAQKIQSDGYPTDRKYRFFKYDENIAESEKTKLDLLALKTFNNKFKTSYV